jgi:hypothetical protein
MFEQEESTDKEAFSFRLKRAVKIGLGFTLVAAVFPADLVAVGKLI